MQVDRGHRDQCCRQAMTCTCCTGRRDFQDSCAITSAWLIWTRERGYKSQSPFLAPPRSHVRLAKSMAQLRNTSESPLRVARTLPDLCATAHNDYKIIAHRLGLDCATVSWITILFCFRDNYRFPSVSPILVRGDGKGTIPP